MKRLSFFLLLFLCLGCSAPKTLSYKQYEKKKEAYIKRQKTLAIISWGIFGVVFIVFTINE